MLRSRAEGDEALQIDRELAGLPRKQDEYMMAIGELREKLELNPRDIRLREQLARKLASMGLVEESTKQWETLLKDAPDHPQAYKALGKQLLASGDRDGAIELLEKSVELSATRTSGWDRVTLASLLHRRALGDYKFPNGGVLGLLATPELMEELRGDMSPQQLDDLDKAIEHYKATVRYFERRKRSSSTQKAQESAKNVGRRPSLAAHASRQLIGALKLKGDFEAAEELEKSQAEGLFPSVRMRELRGKVQPLSDAGKGDEVVDAYREALQDEWSEQERIQLRRVLADRLAQMGEYEEAKELYKSILHDEDLAPVQLAELLLMEGNVEDALHTINQATLQRKPFGLSTTRSVGHSWNPVSWTKPSACCGKRTLTTPSISAFIVISR